MLDLIAIFFLPIAIVFVPMFVIAFLTILGIKILTKIFG